MKLLALLFLVFTSILPEVPAPDGIAVPLMGEHICNQDSYVADGNSFRWSKRLNPGVPSQTYVYEEFAYVFSKNIQKGQTLYVDGTVTDKFQLNLMGGVPLTSLTDCNGVDVLHMVITYNVLGRPKDMALNTWKDCKWNQGVHFKGPFRKGKSFNLALYAGDDGFELRVNGKKYVDFPYRLPLDMVNYINLRQGVTLSNIYLTGQKFEMPYSVWFDTANGFKIGDRLVLTGIDTDIDFKIELHNALERYCLQILVEFDKKLITRNALIDSHWGEAETGGGFPLTSEEEFRLELVNHADALEIIFNGQWFASFKHRQPQGTPFDYNELFRILELSGHLEPRSLVLCKNQP